VSNIRHSNSSGQWGTAPEIRGVARAVLGRIAVDPFSEPEFNALVGAHRILTGRPGEPDGYVDPWVDDPMCPTAANILVAYGRGSARLLSAASRRAAGGEETALVNPPSDPPDARPANAKRAFFLLDEYHKYGWLPGGAIWVGFTVHQLQTLQQSSDMVGDHYRSPLHHAWSMCRCIPSRRSAYVPHSSRAYARALAEWAGRHLRDASGSLADEAFRATPEGRALYQRHVVEGQRGDLDDAPSHPSFILLMPSTDPRRAAEQVRIFAETAGRLGEVF
jgi:hypothetical protein